MSKLISYLQKNATTKRIIVLFVMSHLVLLAMILFTVPILNAQIGTTIFDLQTFGYSVSTAQSIVNNLNEQTTLLYLFPQLTLLDLLYPILLALFLSSLLFRLVNSKTKLGKLVLILPFIAMSFDYLENICIMLMISKTMAISQPIVLISSTFTLLKSLFTFIAWICVMIFAVQWYLSKRKSS